MSTTNDKPQLNNTDPENNEVGFLAHLVELRDRLLRMVMGVGVIFLVLVPFAQDLYNWLAAPLISQLPEGDTLIAIGVASPFLIPYKLALMAAFLFALPYVLYQLWGFIAPALYEHEKKLVFPLVGSSVLLFYAGIAFAYYVVFPLVFGFLTSFAPESVAVTPDINLYLNFVLMMFMAFGIAFEMPIATFLVVSTGMTTVASLKKKRPYVVVVAFIIGMFLTPPDVISQVLLAIPMWLLFEVGLFFSERFIKRDDNKEDNSTKHDMDDDRYSFEEVDTENRYRPMSNEEMDEELRRIEAEEEAEDKAAKKDKQKPENQDDKTKK